MTKTPLVLAATFAASLPGQGIAQPAIDSTGLPPDLAPISREQALQRADSLFAQLDLNHDGMVTRDEAMQATGQLKAERQATGRDVAPGIGGHTARFMAHRFAEAQSITPQQFEQAMLDHFDRMDVDHDGILSTGEREQAREARKQHQ
jgi:hypothetical protein